jgi:glucose-6-phosphate isomerase
MYFCVFFFNFWNSIYFIVFFLLVGAWTGYTGKPLCDIICVGIGGSYLGSEFVFEALKTHQEAKENSKGRRLHFLANIDPVDVERATRDFNPETTLVIIISKTFTTAETMLNAKTLKKWIVDKFGDPTSVGMFKIVLFLSLSFRYFILLL